jgi:serine/threonine-protein kinase
MDSELDAADGNQTDRPATPPRLEPDTKTKPFPPEPTAGTKAAVTPFSRSTPRSSNPRTPTFKTNSGGSGSVAFSTPVEERYELLDLIGTGGMGRVFKARDHQLGRFVAMKFIKDTEEASLVQRFFKEAQAQARIDHEYVCKIYEAGECNGEPYISMQLIEGPTLKGLKGELTLEQKLDAMRKVAEGLHAAHQLGLIHRDIKPSNIMLERKPDGTYHPYVMDFGLARDVSGSDGKTMTDAAVGTPSFMAPEQVRGEAKKLDARTDVYAMGATLYDLLTGRPPFIGAIPIDILLQVAYEDPVPPRTLNPAVSLDLQTIVLKCLEKEPTRRYESALALAEDIQRYLQHAEPIKAKPAPLVYVLWRKARRHWPIVLLGSVLVVSGLVTLTLWIRAGILAQRREAVAEQLGKTVTKIELFSRNTIGMPAHDKKPEQEVLQQQMRFLEGALASGDTNSAGPAHYALGRGHLSLHAYAEAKTNLELAIADGYDKPEVHYALGLTLGKLYEQELDKAQRIGDKDTREAKKKEAEGTYRDPALVHLRQSEGTQVESKAYMEAIVALYEKHYDVALAKADEAAKGAPWLYEARKAEGDARFALGMVAKDKGQNDDAHGAFAKGVEAYKLAADIARSDGMIHEALAETWIQLLEMDVNASKLNKEAFDAVLAACEQALKVNPESSNAYTKRGRAYSQLGAYQFGHGEDQGPTLEKAIESGKAAIQRTPDDAITWDMLGNSYTRLAYSHQVAGQDPSPLLSEATKSFDEALKYQPALAWAWNDAGCVWLFRAQDEAESGSDPRLSVERGAKLYAQAAVLDAAYYWPHTNRAKLMLEGARFALMFGKDPDEYAQQGIESSNRAIQLRPASGKGYFRRLQLLVYVAHYEFLSGRDPTQTLTRIDDDLRVALTDMSNSAEVYATQGEATHLRALHEMRVGTDPSGTLEKGRAALRHAIEIDKVEPYFRVHLARLEMTAARYAVTKGQDPASFLTNARVVLDPVPKINAPGAQALVVIAELHAFRAEYARRLRLNIDDEIKNGLAAADSALTGIPDLPLALAAKGTLELLRAQSQQGNARKLTAQIALSTLERALTRNPLLPERIRLLRDEAKNLADGKPAEVHLTP